MGEYEGDLKSYQGRVANGILSIPDAVRAVVSGANQQFVEMLGSGAIVETFSSDPSLFRICTYGAGSYEEVARFNLQQLPGCCGILVFFHAAVAQKHRGKGLGKLLLQLREKAAILSGYTVAQATVLKDNEEERGLLTDAGWSGQTAQGFKNYRTKNTVLVFFKVLR